MSARLFEHSKLVYRLDFALQGAAMLALGLMLAVGAPPALRIAIVSLVICGVLAWTAIEYAMHRLLFHGVEPFQRWHAEHHHRPSALLGTPTILSAAGIAGLVFLPVFLLGGVWLAAALTLGVLAGYFFYGLTHHATHHWRWQHAWLRRRKRAHALHHHGEHNGNFGVTSAFWDHVFGTVAGSGHGIQGLLRKAGRRAQRDAGRYQTRLSQAGAQIPPGR
jgi:cyclopropane-fatty-acyl-phospholipid synthase